MTDKTVRWRTLFLLLKHAFFLNPALFGEFGAYSFSIVDLRLKINQNVFDQYSFYKDHEEQYRNIDAMTEEERNRFYQDLVSLSRKNSILGLEGVVPLSFATRGFGFGVFESTRFSYEIREGATTIPIIQFQATGEAQMMLGAARNLELYLERNISLGLCAKYLYQVLSEETKTAPALETLDKVGVYHGGTLSFDLGILYKRKNLSLGFAAYDLFSPTISWTAENNPPGGEGPDGRVGAATRIGLSYKPGWKLPISFEDLQLALDMDWPFSGDSSVFNKMSFGAAARLARVLSLRAGFHQGYPTVGLAIGAGAIRMEYAFFGDELGAFPGQITSWNHLVSLCLGWGL